MIWRPKVVLSSISAGILSVASTAFAILPPELTEEFFVADFNHDRVAVYDELGAYVSDFTAEGLDGPRGIVVHSEGSVYVASELSNEVYVFDNEGELQERFSHPDLLRPTGMAMHDGQLFVSSFASDQIVVFEEDGTYSRSFSGGGMNGPNCVAFDSEGNIYVASALTAEIIKFGTNEQFLTTFTGGGLSSPMGIARDANDILYVAGGGSGNVVKFDTEGAFLGEIRHADLTGPQGVAFDDRGHMFASSFYQDNIVEFDADGEYVQTITAGGLDIPRSIAFMPAFEVSVRGDFDGNGLLDAGDVDLLSITLRADQFDARFDLTEDRVVSNDDQRYWVEELVGTQFGDVDLNGTVEFLDFLVLSANFGQTGGWREGDFDGNGEIDFVDFLILSQNFSNSSEVTASAVPEPNTFSLGAFALLGVLSLGRRH